VEHTSAFLIRALKNTATRHAGKNRHPQLINITGFRIVLRPASAGLSLSGMTILFFIWFFKSLLIFASLFIWDWIIFKPPRTLVLSANLNLKLKEAK